MEFEKNIVVNETYQATISVKITKEVIQKEYEALVLKYSKELALPGFRRGKVPVSLLNSKYSKAIVDDLRSNVIKDASEEVFRDIKQEQMPLFPEDVEFHPEGEFNLGVDWLFTIKYDVRPEVKVEKDEGFTLKIPTVYVSDEDVQKELETIQERNALIQDKGDEGEVCAGDLVTVDYQVFDGEVQERQRQDYTFSQDKPSTQYVFENDVLGMKKGETKEIVKTYGDDCEEESLRGGSRRILVTVKAIKEKKLPALDDELAQDVSEEYKTLEDLKNDIKNKLEKQAKGFIFNEKRDALIAMLAKENNVFIPESLIMRAFQGEYEHIFRGAKLSRTDLEKISASLYEVAAPKLTLKLQGQFIMEALLKKYEIKIDDENIQDFLKLLIEENDVSMEMLQELLSDPEKKKVIVSRAEERKVLDILYAKSTFEESEKLSLNAYIDKTEDLGA